MKPELSVANRQRGVRLDVPRLRELGQAALPFCLEERGRSEPPLGGLQEVEVSLVSDRVIARVHQRFMNIPGATDVITFAHGEIVVSVTTAAREARAQAEAVERETLRYLVHGLLHLNGHEDAKPEEAAAMWAVQEEILAALWPS